jgi:SAM-dependent methyltransferase
VIAYPALVQTTFELDLPPAPESTADLLGRTFRETRQNAFHRWYSYVEGFSADYIVATLAELGDSPASLYDPFGGSGTALVEAARRGIPSYFAEANPFMAFVCEAKINSAGWAAEHLSTAVDLLGEYSRDIASPAFARAAERVDLAAYSESLVRRDFFEHSHLRQLILALELARELGETKEHAGRLATLACAANIVDASNMTRRADLRRRKPGEYKTRVVDVCSGVTNSIAAMLEDLAEVGTWGRTIQAATDCRDIADSYDQAFEVAVTSPPYLNGTNYVRNTKLELFLLGFVDTEDDLGPLRHAGVTGGITQAATSREIRNRIPEVEVVATALDGVARDMRIPHLVRAYFSDMLEALRAVFRSLVDGGVFVLDIGDSKFYGVHVPTDRLIAQLAEEVGFVIEEDRVIARRVSRDKSPLVQVDFVLRKPR